MSVIRTIHNKENPYAILAKETINNANLSFKALGLWVWAMSKPDNWHFHVDKISEIRKEGKRAIYSAINELIAQGYCIRFQKRTHLENGNTGFDGVEYLFFEHKPNPEEIEEFKKRLLQSGFVHAQSVDAQNAEALVYNDIIPLKEELLENTEINNTPPTPKVPPEKLQKKEGGGEEKKEDLPDKKDSILEEAKKFRCGDIAYRDATGEVRTCTESQLFRFLSKHKFSFAVIEEAVRQIRIYSGTIANFYNFFEKICLRLTQENYSIEPQKVKEMPTSVPKYTGPLVGSEFFRKTTKTEDREKNANKTPLS